MRRLLLLLSLLLLSAPAFAACDLGMTVSCQNGSCTSVTTNNGSSSCSGLIYSIWFSEAGPDAAHLSAPETNFGSVSECFGSGDLGGGEDVDISFALCFGEGSIGPGQSFRSTVHVSGAADVPLVAVTWIGTEEEEVGSAFAFTNAPTPTCIPTVSAPPVTQSGVEYTVSWSAISDPSAQFLVEESTSADFTANLTQRQVNGLSTTFRHDNLPASTIYYYRVRATHCVGGQPSFSTTSTTVVQAEPAPGTKNAEVAVPFGSTNPVQMKVFIPGFQGLGKSGTNTTFTATTDKPYLTVTPSSGTLPPQGTTVTVTANPAALPPGANTGTLAVTAVNPVTGQPATSNIPVSVSLVTPVMPISKSLPPLNALMIPIVTHVNGAAAQFLSDVRLTNSGNQPVDYQVTMTPTRTDATQSSKATLVTVEGQQTIALNDIVKNFFGYGATQNPGDSGFGSLEIRPLNTSSPATYASSRTYASTLGGTYGQFIAAMPFSKFATKRLSGIPIPGQPEASSSSTLSLQQIAQSTKFRTNLGIVEGSGEAASGRIRIFNAVGNLLKEVPFSLMPGEHRQMNSFISDPNFGGIPSLEDGRIEIAVDSPTGAVTAYASVLDNVTTDPLAVMPVAADKIEATRYVVPGIAELPNRADNFHSDLRVFNGGTTDMPIQLTYYPQGNGAPVTAQPRTVRAGEVLVLDNILPALFNASNTGGSVVITSASKSSLVATGRTYTEVAGGGTYGQFIPGVTPAEGIGLGERALQLMQLEESSRFRSNVGLAELTGHETTVRLTLFLPDTKTTASTELTLAPNEFRQFRPVAGLNPGQQTYNARIAVEVVSGTGRVTAYGSVIDNESKDPTYVPAQ
ncbi:MAG: hypothetical protein M3Q69_16035 [Acidobacteriota bacterium]|nr:hypothetical protein [Acidobacteriota bacterium]